MGKRETDMTQQETHPTTSEPTTPQWYGEPTPWRPPATGYDPFAPAPDHATEPPAEAGTPTGAGPAWPSEPYATPGGSGPGSTAYPPPTQTPDPRNRPVRRIAEMSAVALLAAALASGGTFAATRYADAGTPTASPSTSAAQNPAAPVVQANGSTPDWSATAKAVAPSVVSITVASGQAEGQGSGVVIDKAGHILTNNHVATGAGANATISVTLSDGRTYDAKIVGTDPTTDLAVLSLANPPADLTPISVGDSGALVVGQPVMAVGNPLGLAGTVTTGIVSALNRPVATSASEAAQSGGGNPVVTNAIQTSAAINPGNSGGALVTADGQLIGINSSIASLGSSSGGQSGNIGIGFAIPSNEAKSIADQLIASGSAQHAFLGVTTSDTTVTDGGSKRQAALVRDVTTGTPAAKSGLQPNDAVVAIDGQSVDSSQSLVANVHAHKVGDAVTLTVVRGGTRQDVKITLAARPGQG